VPPTIDIDQEEQRNQRGVAEIHGMAEGENPDSFLRNKNLLVSPLMQGFKTRDAAAASADDADDAGAGAVPVAVSKELLPPFSPMLPSASDEEGSSTITTPDSARQGAKVKIQR
jgi:hypothetical protein